MAKALAGRIQPDKRTMLKVKHERDCDCVVAGFRWHKDGEGTAVGSLLLGLYDDAGSAAACGRVRELHDGEAEGAGGVSAPYRENALKGHPWAGWAAARTRGPRMPGGAEPVERGQGPGWEPLRPELVVEVAYEHMQGDRFRHMAQFRRWRADKAPRDVRMRSWRWCRRRS